MEKVVNEFKVVETDDGYRIEIKGGKEMWRLILSGFSLYNFFKDKPPFDSNMEKVVNEFKVVETDDGYRIEIKGNKKMCRWILSGFGSGPWGSGFGSGPWGSGFGSGPWGSGFGSGPRFRGKSAWCGEPEDNK